MYNFIQGELICNICPTDSTIICLYALRCSVVEAVNTTKSVINYLCYFPLYIISIRISTGKGSFVCLRMESLFLCKNLFF